MQFFKEVNSELKKVVWPTPQEALKLSAIVIVSAGIVAAAFAVIDMGVLEALKALLGGNL